MLARRFLELDFDEVEKWFVRRNQPMPDKSLFPKVGFIVDGIAAGFIYFTDSFVAIIDCYISNSDSDSKMRSDALDIITKSLINMARFHKCKVIKCDTQLESVKQRALQHGFKSLGTYESFSINLISEVTPIAKQREGDDMEWVAY